MAVGRLPGAILPLFKILIPAGERMAGPSLCAALGVTLMFGFLNSKAASQRKAEAAAEATVRHGHVVWDMADVERRTSLLRRALGTQDDRLFLAYIHAPWSQIPDGVRVKLALAVMAQEENDALFLKLDRIRALGDKAGKSVAQCFSVEQFCEFFGQKSFSGNWTLEEALGIWYALGRFCFLISIGSLEGIQDADMNSLLVCGQGGLETTWRMPEATLSRFEDFNATKLAAAYSVYKSIDNGEKFGRFFSLFISEILGNDVSFSLNDFSKGMVAQVLQGERMEMDPFLANEVSSMFVKVKKSIHAYIYTGLRDILTDFASALKS